MYSLVLAWRYARSRLVNLVAVLAVALALTVQIVVMAVLDGMLEDMRHRIRGLGEQVSLVFYGELPSLKEMDRVEKMLCKAVPGVVGITPLIQDYAGIERHGYMTPVLAYGIDLKREAKLSQLRSHLLDFTLKPDAPQWSASPEALAGRTPLFIGAQVAERLKVRAGDTLKLSYLPPGSDRAQRREFVVTSVFRSGSLLNDRWVVYIPLRAAQAMFLDPSAKNGTPRARIFSVWLKDPDQADALQSRIVKAAQAVLGPRPMDCYTWQEQWRTLSEGMEYENRLQELILLLMNLSGGFCVFAIMATLVSRRARDVGLLRCIGASRGGVVLSFLLVGLIIGLAGSLLGLGAGYALSEPGLFLDKGRPLVDYLHEQIMGEPLYPPRMFLVGGIKPIFGFKVVLYALGATVISVLAAAYPAIWAGTREPVEALHNE